MYQAKLFCFLIYFVVTVSPQSDVDDVGVKRSAICLIQRVAQHNHINATYTKLNFEHRNATTYVEAKLELGNEHYLSNSTSFTKAKERVAQQAYAKTKYTKPEIRNRTCLINTIATKSDISLLEEFADAIGSPVYYEEKFDLPNRTWTYEISLNGQKAVANSEKKKTAKKLAATNLIEKIGRSQIIDRLTSKFNKTEYHSMEPTKRLRKIVQVSDAMGDGVYSILRELSKKKDGKNVKSYVVQVEAKDFMTTGEGYSVAEARNHAAANLLKYLNFVVDYPPKTTN